MTDPIEEIKADVADALLEPDDVLESELRSLWFDLNEARNHAINGVWSMQCDSLVYRIARLTNFIGKPTDWSRIQFPLLLNGWYEAINEAAGFPTPLSDEDRALVQFYSDMMKAKS